jgi:hypothetical protein
MKRTSGLLCTFFGCLIVYSCSKSNNSGNNTPPVDSVALLKSQLAGKWNVVKYSATNFLITSIPDQSWAPAHPEFQQFYADSAHYDSWETFWFDVTTPQIFFVKQDKEYATSVGYSMGKGMYILNFQPGIVIDTNFVVSISSTQLETLQKMGGDGSGTYEYNLHTYFQR